MPVLKILRSRSRNSSQAHIISSNCECRYWRCVSSWYPLEVVTRRACSRTLISSSPTPCRSIQQVRVIDRQRPPLGRFSLVLDPPTRSVWSVAPKSRQLRAAHRPRLYVRGFAQCRRSVGFRVLQCDCVTPLCSHSRQCKIPCDSWYLTTNMKLALLTIW